MNQYCTIFIISSMLTNQSLTHVACFRDNAGSGC